MNEKQRQELEESVASARERVTALNRQVAGAEQTLTYLKGQRDAAAEALHELCEGL